MKITCVRTLVVNAEMRNWVFVRVETLTSAPTFCQMVGKGVLSIAAVVIAGHQSRRYG